MSIAASGFREPPGQPSRYPALDASYERTVDAVHRSIRSLLRCSMGLSVCAFTMSCERLRAVTHRASRKTHTHGDSPLVLVLCTRRGDAGGSYFACVVRFDRRSLPDCCSRRNAPYTAARCSRAAARRAHRIVAIDRLPVMISSARFALQRALTIAGSCPRRVLILLRRTPSFRPSLLAARGFVPVRSPLAPLRTAFSARADVRCLVYSRSGGARGRSAVSARTRSSRPRSVSQARAAAATPLRGTPRE